ALGHTTAYAYDGRDNRTQTVDANGHASRQVWDGLGRVVDTITQQNGQEIHERKAYDAYGNQVSITDGEGRVTSQVYGAFGRVIEEIDPGGRQTFYEYDDQGRLVREYAATGQDIRRSYDDAGRLLEVHDLGTGVKTVYGYDLAGQRLAEDIDSNGDGLFDASAHERSIRYEYDAIGQMVRWVDSVTGLHTNYQWDAAGNLHRAYTDLGYDPDSEGLDANTRFVDHRYSYDGNNQITRIDQRGA
uniref:hypothetical protein n=1 Tax=Sedimenticola hydrogenitrophicus TaxID=2967975 RepID=UPI0021A6F5E8